MPQIPRRAAFDEFDELVNSKLRVNPAEQMNVVKQDFQFNEFALSFLGDFMDNGFQPLGDVGGQNLPAVLWAKDDVVLAGIGYVVV